MVELLGDCRRHHVQQHPSRVAESLASDVPMRVESGVGEDLGWSLRVVPDEWERGLLIVGPKDKEEEEDLKKKEEVEGSVNFHKKEQKTWNLLRHMNLLQKFKINHPKQSFLTSLLKAHHFIDGRFLKLLSRPNSQSLSRFPSKNKAKPERKAPRPSRDFMQKQKNKCSERISFLTQEINKVRRERRELEKICGEYKGEIQRKREKLKSLKQLQARRMESKRMQRIKSFEEDVMEVRFQKQFCKDLKIYRKQISLDRPLERPVEWPKLEKPVLLTEQETFRKKVRSDEPCLASIKQVESLLGQFQQLCSQNECSSLSQINSIYGQSLRVQEKLKDQIISVRQQVMELKSLKKRLLKEQHCKQELQASNYQSLRSQRLRCLQIQQFQLQDQLSRENKQFLEKQVRWNKIVSTLKEIQFCLTSKSQTDFASTLVQIQDGLLGLERHQLLQSKNKRHQWEHQSDVRVLEQRLRECREGREGKESGLMSRGEFERCFFERQRKSKLKRK